MRSLINIVSLATIIALYGGRQLMFLPNHFFWLRLERTIIVANRWRPTVPGPVVPPLPPVAPQSGAAALVQP